MSCIIFPPEKSGCDGNTIDTEREPFKTVMNAVKSELEKNENHKALEKRSVHIKLKRTI